MSSVLGILNTVGVNLESKPFEDKGKKVFGPREMASLKVQVVRLGQNFSLKH